MDTYSYMKICSKCSKTKDFFDFGIKLDNIWSRCKECTNVDYKVRYYNNNEKRFNKKKYNNNDTNVCSKWKKLEDLVDKFDKTLERYRSKCINEYFKKS